MALRVQAGASSENWLDYFLLRRLGSDSGLFEGFECAAADQVANQRQLRLTFLRMEVLRAELWSYFWPNCDCSGFVMVGSVLTELV